MGAIKCYEKAGFKYEGTFRDDVIICLDDDGRTPPEQMFKLIDRLGEDCDAVFAKYVHKKHSLSRNFGSKVNDLKAEYMIGKPKDLSIMSYLCCKRFVVDEIIKYDNPYPYLAGMILRTTK